MAHPGSQPGNPWTLDITDLSGTSLLTPGWLTVHSQLWINKCCGHNMVRSTGQPSTRLLGSSFPALPPSYSLLEKAQLFWKQTACFEKRMKTQLCLFTFPTPSRRGCCKRWVSCTHMHGQLLSPPYGSGHCWTHRPAAVQGSPGGCGQWPCRWKKQPFSLEIKHKPLRPARGLLLLGWFCGGWSPRLPLAPPPDTLRAMNRTQRNTRQPSPYSRHFYT